MSLVRGIGTILQTLEDVMKKEQCDKGYAMVKIFKKYGSFKDQLAKIRISWVH